MTTNKSEFTTPEPLLLSSQTMPSGETREIRLIAAFVDPEPRRYGICSARLQFVVKRGGVGVAWLWHTDWYLRGTSRRLSELPGRHSYADGLGSIDYHSPVANYEGQEPVTESCDVIGGRCYMDGSCLASSALYERMVGGELGEPWKTLMEWLEEQEGKVKEQREMERNFS